MSCPYSFPVSPACAPVSSLLLWWEWAYRKAMEASRVNMSLTVTFQFHKGVQWDFVTVCTFIMCPSASAPMWGRA